MRLLPDEALIRNVCKYVRYGLETRCFTPASDKIVPSHQALATAAAIRGKHDPAILIHGIMPRSGTVYVGQLLRLHPDIHAYPNNLWEAPVLQQTARMIGLQEEFLWSYEQNMDKIGHRDFLPLFGASFIAYLHVDSPPDRRLLLKVPSVQYLDYFYKVFPHEHLLVLMRDGRDVVHSTLNTWPSLRFSMVCARWRHAAQMALVCHQQFQSRPNGYWLGRFEDAMYKPESFVRAACQRFGLDSVRYPYDLAHEIPVHGSSATGQGGKVTWKPIRRPQDFNPIGHWREWSTLRKAVFKLIAGRQLIALGYEHDMNW